MSSLQWLQSGSPVWELIQLWPQAVSSQHPWQGELGLWPRAKSRCASHVWSCSLQGRWKPWGRGWGSGQSCFPGTENKARQDIPRGQDALSYRLRGGKPQASWESLCGTWILTELFAPWGSQPLRIHLGRPCVCLQWVQEKSVLSK